MKDLRLPDFSVEDILKATGGRLIQGGHERIFRGISTDSRTLTNDNLFIPIAGDKFDGHDFTGSALKNGAAGLLIQAGKEEKLKNVPENVSVVLVNDTVKALGDIAHFWRKRFDIPVIAVTGSSGKTTTKEMIASIAGLSKNVLRNYGNFNNFIGLPLTLLKINSDHEAIVIEMGANKRGEIARLAEIAKPDIGVITNVGPAHLEGLKSLEGVREEKGNLFSSMKDRGVAIINNDDKEIKILAERWGGKSITFGIGSDAFIHAENIIKKRDMGVNFTLRIGKFKRKINLSTLGEHNIYNALAAAASSCALGIDYNLICKGLGAFKQIGGRMDLHRLKNGAYLIDDTYNANPASVMEALRSLKELKGSCESTVVLGDMLELGEQAEKIHEDIGMRLADRSIGKIFLMGRLSYSVAAGAIQSGFKSDQIFFIDNPVKLAMCLKSYLKKGDWVLVKGSRKMKMEDIVMAIIKVFGEQKGR